MQIGSAPCRDTLIGHASNPSADCSGPPGEPGSTRDGELDSRRPITLPTGRRIHPLPRCPDHREQRQRQEACRHPRFARAQAPKARIAARSTRAAPPVSKP